MPEHDKRARTARVVGLVLVVVAACILFWRDARRGALVVREGPEPRPRERPLAPVSPTLQSGGRVSLTDDSGNRSSSGATADPALEVGGWVLREDGNGLAGVRVNLRGRVGPEESAQVTTAEDGSFDAELAASAWRIGDLCNVHVESVDGNRLFTGTCQLGTEMTFLLQEAIPLAGRLEVFPAQAPPNSFVRIEVPAVDKRSSSVYVGRASLDDRGRFFLAARPPMPTDSFRLQFESGGVAYGSAVVTVDELVSDDGAVITLERRRLALRVEDPRGRALPDVEVQAWYSLEDFGATGSTDADGRVEFLLPPGTVDLCAGHEDWSPRLWSVDGSREQSQTVVLEERSFRMLTGFVLAASGDPVSGARVSAVPRAPGNIGWAAYAAAETDTDGAFSVEVPRGHSIEVLATHRDHWMTPTTTVDQATDSVTLEFLPQGNLTIRLAAAPTETITRPGPVRYWLCHRDREIVLARHGWQTPLTANGIAAGSYNLFVYWAGMDVFAASEVEIISGESREVSVGLEPAAWIRGTVHDEEGAPVSEAVVEIMRLDWPPEVTRALGARTADDGSFHVCAGQSGATVGLRVKAADGRSMLWSGVAPSSLVLQLPNH